MKIRTLLIFFFLLLEINSKAQTFRSVNNPPNNLWNDAASWDLGSIPTSGDTVLILNNDTIVVNSNTNIDKITLRGNGELQVNTGFTLSVLQNVSVQAQNNNGNTTSLIVNGTLSVGNNLAITSRKRVSYTAEISGTGNITTVNNFLLTGDTTGAVVSISCPISVGKNFMATAKNADGELSTSLNSSITTTTNFTLRTQNGADSNNNVFDMRFAGASLNIGNNLSLSGGGGFLQNSSATSTDVYFTIPSKILVSNQIEYHDVHLTTTSNVGSNEDWSNILGDLIIDNGCTITTNKRTVKMSSGNLIVNGAISSSGGDDSLIFNGSSAQTISGSGSATIENLIIQNSNGVSNTLGIDIIKVLSIQSGAFSTGGAITLKSTSSRTAYISEIGNNGVGASISGSVTCERNINGAASAGYRQLSSPTQGAQIANLQDGTSPIGIYTYGFTGSNLPSAGGFNSCYKYDPALANASGDANDGWVAATNSTNSVTPHEAWSIYIGGSNGSGAKSTYDLSTTGAIYSGPMTMNSSNANIAANSGGTQEWGLIGNPYPSTIQWDNVSKSNISAIAQIYAEDDFNGYRTTNFNAGANRIPPFQAFWVQTTGSSPSITFEENDKITNNISYRKVSQFENRLYLEVLDSVHDFKVEACIEFNSNATPQFDYQLDGIIFENPGPFPNLFFPIQDSLHGQVYSTNSNHDQVIPLKVYASKGKSGICMLKFNQLPEIKSCIRLEDRKKGIFITVDTATSYSFIIGEDEKENRFYIHYSTGITNLSSSHLTCFKNNDGEISFNSTSTMYNPALIEQASNSTKPLNLVGNLWQAKDLEAGKYVISLKGTNSCKNLDYPITILEPKIVKSKFNSSYLFYNIREEIKFSNSSEGSSNFIWNFGDGSSSKLFEPHKKYDREGTYEVKLIASNGNNDCRDSSVSTIFITDYLAVSNENVNEESLKLASANEGFLLIPNFDKPTSSSIVVYSINGVVCNESNIILEKSDVRLFVPKNPGIYIISVLTNNGEQRFKIVQE